VGGGGAGVAVLAGVGTRVVGRAVGERVGNDLSWNQRGRWNRCRWYRRKGRAYGGARGNEGERWRGIGARNQIGCSTTENDKQKNATKR